MRATTNRLVYSGFCIVPAVGVQRVSCDEWEAMTGSGGRLIMHFCLFLEAIDSC